MPRTHDPETKQIFTEEQVLRLVDGGYPSVRVLPHGTLKVHIEGADCAVELDDADHAREVAAMLNRAAELIAEAR